MSIDNTMKNKNGQKIRLIPDERISPKYKHFVSSDRHMNAMLPPMSWLGCALWVIGAVLALIVITS